MEEISDEFSVKSSAAICITSIATRVLVKKLTIAASVDVEDSVDLTLGVAVLPLALDFTLAFLQPAVSVIQPVFRISEKRKTGERAEDDQVTRY